MSSSSSSNLFEDDDEENLSLFLRTSFSDNRQIGNLNLSKTKSFQGFSKRLLSDIKANVYTNFWDSLIVQAKAIGFSLPDITNTFDLESNVSDAEHSKNNSNTSFPAAFLTPKGKAHVSATSSLFSVSACRAVGITLSALRSLDPDKKSSQISISSLLGTRTLLLLVRDYHYSQQVARIRLITESLRSEEQTESEETDKSSVDFCDILNSVCTNLLNELDDCVAFSGKRRGLFQILLSLACGFKKTLNKNNLQASYLLSNVPNGAFRRDIKHEASLNTVSSFCSKDELESNHEFAKDLIYHHTQHHCQNLPTEALEALLVLLYERIDGGVSRCDYALLLLGLEKQSFFVESEVNKAIENGSAKKKRMSQLSSLILAESMTLWRTTTTGNENSGNINWITTHPLLTGESLDIVKRELNFIGKNLLLQRYSIAVLKRRKIFFRIQRKRNSGKDINDMVTNERNRNDQKEDDEENIQAPESIAILTFGLLLELASKENSLWNDLATECVSVANDNCGAFTYLHNVMEILLPPSSMNQWSYRTKKEGKFGNFDWLAYVLENSQNRFKLTNGKVDSQSLQETHTNLAEVENASIVAYASIGREILFGTLVAYHKSLIESMSSATVDNIGMLCSLTSSIYRNTNVLCNRFWMDWDDYCSTRAIKGSDTVPNADPLCNLLDTSFILASSALERQIQEDENSGKAIDGWKYISMLPSLVPFLRLTSSLIPTQGNKVQEVISKFLPDNLLHICLVACAHLCSSANVGKMAAEFVTKENLPYVHAATGAMEALETLSHFICRSDKKVGQLFRKALETKNDISSSNTSAPRLLYLIANEALACTMLGKKTCIQISSSALAVMAALLQCRNTNDARWLLQVENCFEEKSDQNGMNESMGGFSVFTAGGMNQVTVSCMLLLNKMASNITQMLFLGCVDENEMSKYINTVGNGAIVACDLLSLSLKNHAQISATCQQLVVNGAFTFLYSFFNSLLCVIDYHVIDNVRITARNVRDTLIQMISSSTGISNAVAYHAVLPISLGLVTTIEDYIENNKLLQEAETVNKHKKLENEKYESWGFLIKEGNKVKKNVSSSFHSYSASLVCDIGQVPFPNRCYSQDSPSILDTADKAISFLQLWGDISERMAFENAGIEGKGCVSVKDAAEILSVNELEIFSSFLQLHGPSRLLLSLALPPVLIGETTEYWPEYGINNLNLISRYLTSFEQGDCTMSEVSPKEFSSKASDLIVSSLMHLTDDILISDHSKLSHDNFPQDVCVTKILGGGTQIHNALIKLLKYVLKEDRTNYEETIKQTSSLLQMLECIIYQIPTLAVQILSGKIEHNNNCESEIIDMLIQLLDWNENQTKNTNDAVLASSCINVIFALYQSCHVGRNESRNSHKLVRRSPLHSIVSTLVSKQILIRTCSQIVINSASILNNAPHTFCSDEDTQDFDVAGSVKKAALLNLVTKAFEMFTNDLLCFINGKNKVLIETDFILDLLIKLSKGNLLEAMFKVLMSYDGAIHTSHHDKQFSDFYKQSKFHFTQLRITCMDLSALLTCDFFFERPELMNLLVSAHSASILAKCQIHLISSFSRFVNILFVALSTGAFRKHESMSQDANPIELSILALEMSERTLCSMKQYAQCLVVSSLYNPMTNFQVSNAAYAMSHLLASMVAFYNESKKDANNHSSDRVTHLCEMLNELLTSAERYFVLTEQPDFHKFHVEIGCGTRQSLLVAGRLRLQLFTCALLILNAIKDDTSTVNLDKQQLDDLCLGFCRLVCNTLSLLKYVPFNKDISEKSKTRSAYFEYNFESSTAIAFEESQDNFSCISLDLLRVSISLLTAILPIESESSTSFSFSSHVFCSNLAQMLHSCGALADIFKHLEASSNIIAVTYPVKFNLEKSVSSLEIHDRAIDVSTRIIDFIVSLAGSRCSALSEVLLNNNLVRSIVDNRALLVACENWSSLSHTGFARGYHQTNLNHLDSTTDSFHYFWQSSIRTITCLLQSCTVDDSSTPGIVNSSTSSVYQRCTNAAMDFVSKFERTLFCCLQECTAQGKHSSSYSNDFDDNPRSSFNSLPASSSSLPFSFTINILEESREILMLMSELCAGDRKKIFEASFPTIYQKFTEIASGITKTLSSFLGTLGTARELFSVLSSLSGAIEGNGNWDDNIPNTLDETLILHPLFMDGVPNARHEAIRNAHFVSSCCICMTADDYKLSLSGTSYDHDSYSSKQDSSHSLEQNFQKQIESDFTIKLEKIACECLFNAISILGKTHPTTSSFIAFNKNEAMNLNLSSIIDTNTIVSLRPPLGKNMIDFNTKANSLKYSAKSVKYAKVISFNNLSSTMEVEYLESSWLNNNSLFEKNVSSSRLAGMEDLTKNQSIFEYSPAPKSLSDNINYNSKELSLGHLILALRWCREHTKVSKKRFSIPTKLLQSIAECSIILLGTEISLHHLLGTLDTVTKDIDNQINEQMLQLFDQVDSAQNLNLLSSGQNNFGSGQGVRSIIGDDVWDAVLQQIRNSLNKGLNEREVTRKKSEQSLGGTGGTLGWRPSMRRGGVKSPFRKMSV